MFKRHGSSLALLCVTLVALLSACAGPREPDPNLLAPTEAQLKLRSIQTRTFEVSSREMAIRAVIESLQDLGFIIERAHEGMGVVTAARFAEPDFTDILEVTVTVRPGGDGGMLVRANAIFNNEPITEPKVYQNFFAALERSVFLGRN